jgi:hypothetical protein
MMEDVTDASIYVGARRHAPPPHVGYFRVRSNRRR